MTLAEIIKICNLLKLEVKFSPCLDSIIEIQLFPLFGGKTCTQTLPVVRFNETQIVIEIESLLKNFKAIN